MLALTLIRHANTTWNTEGKWQGHSDVPLSALGEQQSRALGQRLSDEHFDVAYASDLQRARATAELALAAAKIGEYKHDHRLREVHFGDFEGLTRAQAQQHHAWLGWAAEPWSAAFPQGESLQAVAARLRQWADDLPERGQVVAVSHGLAIRALLWSVMNWPLPQANPAYPFPFNIKVPHASLSRLERRAGRWELLTLGDAGHLEAWSRSRYAGA